MIYDEEARYNLNYKNELEFENYETLKKMF